MQQIPFSDSFKSALHVLGEKLAHPQEHFLTVYTAFCMMHQYCCQPVTRLSPVSSNIGALYEKLYIQSKSAPENGRVFRLKHVRLI